MGCVPSIEKQPPPDPDPIDIHLDQAKNKYRPSIVSLQIPNEFKDDVSSDGMSERSEHEGQDEEYLCGSDISLQWLLQRIEEKLGRKLEEEPQWITERLNRPNVDEYATSSVIRVTFGWEDEELPKSIILKTPVSKELREDEEGKFHYIMFKRECNVYEWTQKFPRLASPFIYHIKRHSKEGSGVVVMDDFGEKGTQQDAIKGVSVEAIRDVLKHLAYLHAESMRHTSWSTLIADLPPSYYSHIIGNFDATMDFFENQDVEHSRFVYLAKYFTTDYLHSTATEAADDMKVPKVLVHGEPYAANIFILNDSKDSQVAGIIDWTECHAGSFAEDLAKTICWNLTSKDRMECTSGLLDSYHANLMEYSNGECNITLDQVRKAYQKFIPFAMVTLIGKVMSHKDDVDVDAESLVDRAKTLIQQVYATTRLADEN